MNRLIVFLILFSFFGCVEEIEVFKGTADSFVVDGTITTDPGPHLVRLGYSRQYNTKPDFSRVEGASVSIIDDEGNTEQLTYALNGNYITSQAFSAVPGKSYRIKITLKNGEEYESLPEKCLAVPELTALSAKLNGTKLDFSVDFTDDLETENYYRWRYNGTYEFIAPVAYEMSKTNQRMKKGDCITWEGPAPFAKDIYRCWVKEADVEYLKVEDDLLFNGKQMTNYHLFSLDLLQKFNRGYFAEVKQYSLTKAAHTYWSGIQGQMGNNGTIFESPNYQIRGNIRAVENPDMNVLGYFGVSSVSTASLFVGDFMGLFGEIPCETNNSGCYPERCMDCRRAAASATTTKPDYWPY